MAKVVNMECSKLGITRNTVGRRIRKGIHLIAFCAVGLGFLYGTSDAEEPRQTRRVRNGLVALYDFGSVQDKRLPDRSGLGEAADLRLGETEAVQLTAGYLAIGTPTRIQSLDRPAKISDLVRVLGELTVEVWIEPSADNGSEPASIVTMSNGTDQQNFEFGQDNGRFQVHFRTSQTGRDGAPPISTPNGTALPELTHVVSTHDRSGRARMFLNGKIAVERIIPGSTLDWEKTTLLIGNGPRGKRPWLGTYRLVAIYGRDLLAGEVARNFLAGPSPPSIEISNVSHNQSLFEAKVAPLLASRCLDCHDSTVRQGGWISQDTKRPWPVGTMATRSCQETRILAWSG